MREDRVHAGIREQDLERADGARGRVAVACRSDVLAQLTGNAGDGTQPSHRTPSAAVTPAVRWLMAAPAAITPATVPVPSAGISSTPWCARAAGSGAGAVAAKWGATSCPIT